MESIIKMNLEIGSMGQLVQKGAIVGVRGRHVSVWRQQRGWGGCRQWGSASSDGNGSDGDGRFTSLNPPFS